MSSRHPHRPKEPRKGCTPLEESTPFLAHANGVTTSPTLASAGAQDPFKRWTLLPKQGVATSPTWASTGAQDPLRDLARLFNLERRVNVPSRLLHVKALQLELQTHMDTPDFEVHSQWTGAHLHGLVAAVTVRGDTEAELDQREALVRRSVDKLMRAAEGFASITGANEAHTMALMTDAIGRNQERALEAMQDPAKARSIAEDDRRGWSQALFGEYPPSSTFRLQLLDAFLESRARTVRPGSISAPRTIQGIQQIIEAIKMFVRSEALFEDEVLKVRMRTMAFTTLEALAHVSTTSGQIEEPKKEGRW